MATIDTIIYIENVAEYDHQSELKHELNEQRITELYSALAITNEKLAEANVSIDILTARINELYAITSAQNVRITTLESSGVELQNITSSHQSLLSGLTSADVDIVNDVYVLKKKFGSLTGEMD